MSRFVLGRVLTSKFTENFEGNFKYLCLDRKSFFENVRAYHYTLNFGSELSKLRKNYNFFQKMDDLGLT